MAKKQNEHVSFKFPRVFNDEACTNPNKWFIERFPSQAKQFGAPFLEATDAHTGKIVMSEINEDFLAAILGGDARLNLRVVYFQPEELFYFYDYRHEAYVPTSEEKLGILLSNYLVRAATACSGFVDISSMITRFRSKEVTKGILARAKAILRADDLFFKGEGGKKRYLSGKMVNPTDLPSYRLFAKEQLMPLPGSRVMEKDMWPRYFQFCKDQGIPPLARSEFRSMMAGELRDELNLIMRNDVVDENGKQNRGWIGLSYRSSSNPVSICSN